MSGVSAALSQEILIAATCTSVATRFMAHFDANDGAGMAELFTADGEWTRIDGVVRGRAALLEMMARRPGSILLQHILTNFIEDVRGPDRAVVRSVVTVYRHDFMGERRQLPVPLDGVHAVGRYVDELVLTETGWKIARKSSESVFVRTEALGDRT